MLAVRKRLGASVLLTALSLISIILLLPTSGVTTHLRKIPGLGTTIDGYKGILGWGSGVEKQVAGGIRLVVFGDSWVDNRVEEGWEGKGRSWTDVLCAEMNCTSHLNFAESQSFSSSPSSPPAGAVTSNKIHENATASSQFTSIELANDTLTDLAAQVQSFIALPQPSSDSGETIFVVSFGFWDIYNLASMDYSSSTAAADASIEEIFTQLDILYAHIKYNAPQTPRLDGSNTTDVPSTFRVIVPKLFDPTLLPGWQSQRPMPLYPSSVAEQQKNAVYLTNRWNIALENKLGGWMSTNPKPLPNQPDIKMEKDVFYYDLPSYLLDLIIERSLEIEGLSDALGLGDGESPYENVYLPCVSDSEEDAEDIEELVEINGQLICKNPRDYLFWDSWTIGPVANEEVGKMIGRMMREGDSLRSAWRESMKSGFVKI